MTPCPSVVDSFPVRFFTPLDARHEPTGKTAHLVAGQPLGPAAGLVICEGEEGFYLFYCNEKWEPCTDTWHETIEDAMDRADFEYKGARATWQTAA